MRKTLLFVVVACMLTGVPGYASAKTGKALDVRKALADANRKAASMSAMDVARAFHPETVVTEVYTSDNTWSEPFTTKYTYNKAGQVLTMSFSLYDGVNEYEYDESGRLIKAIFYILSDGKKTPTSATEYCYDTIVKDLVVKTLNYNFNNDTDQLELGMAIGMELTRNSDGNVTMVRDYIESNGDKSYDTEYLEIEYGTDKKAVKMTHHGYDEYDLIVLSDIVWECTDGQITTYEYDDYKDAMYFSNNRIASATITRERYPLPGKFTATYDGDNYHSKVICGEDTALEFDFKCNQKFPARENFDLRYNYDCTAFKASFEDEDDSYYVEYTDEDVIENNVDAFGIELSYKKVTTTKYPSPQHQYDDSVVTEARKAEVSYDETYGYPLTAVYYNTMWDSDEFVLNSRINFCDYVNVDPAGVSSAEVSQDVAAEYFTLQGLRVQGNPAPGLYLCRKGNTISKVLVR